MSAPTWGILAEFEDVPAILRAAAGVRDAGFTRWDAHTPFPVHGLNEAMGLQPTRLPWVVFGAGMSGALGALLLQWWTNAVDYPFNISGKPLFSLPADIPVMFEGTILLAAITAFVGMLVANGLPSWHHPAFRSPRFTRATDDRFFLTIEASDPRYDPDATRALLCSLGALGVEDLEG
ncbi:MAG: DUF3341 domain-containing protein [Pseudomonadota bacterium]